MQDKGYTPLYNSFNFSRLTIWSIIKKYNQIYYLENKLKIGREQLISERMERKIIGDVSKNLHLTAKDIVHDVKIAGLNISTMTVARYLHLTGL